MTRFEEMYNEKKMTAETVAKQIRPGDLCACPTALAEPRTITRAIARRAREDESLKGVKHHITFPQYPSELYDDPDLAGRYEGVLWFVGAPARAAVNDGRADMMPCFFKDIPGLWRREVKPDVFYATVSPMDKHGYFSFGLVAAESMAQFERAERRYLEVNTRMPRTFGTALVHISQVDGLCESDEEILTFPELKSKDDLDEVSLAIGNYVAEEIPNGATLQLGWGNVPNAVGLALMDKRNLGLHTELFSDSMMTLIECGAVDNSAKKINRFKSVATFALGSRRVYDYMDDNPSVEILGVDYVNNPAIIAQNDNVISVNAGLEVDFFGQVAAETLNGRPFSSTGGQVDFVRGAQMSKEGKSFVTMPATAKGGEISRIAPFLAQGSVVTTGKNDVDCIVTEFGVARLKGKTWSQRAKALIAIAAPPFREELTFQAKKQNIMI